MNIERYLIDTNNFCPMLVSEWVKRDDKIMKEYGVCVMAIKHTPKYKTSKQRQRKLKATKIEFMDLYVIRLIRQKIIKTNIINDSIKDYFQKIKPIVKTHDLSFDELMMELDEILNEPLSPQPPQEEQYSKVSSQILSLHSCNCSLEGFGFCFCVKSNGEWLRTFP